MYLSESRARGASRLSITVLLLIVLCHMPHLVHAGSVFGQAMGTIGLSASSSEWDDSLDISPFVPFRIYLLADFSYGEIGEPELDPYVGIQAWEASISIPGVLTEFVISAFEVSNSSVRIGSPTNMIVGLRDPIMASRTNIPLVSYDILLLNPNLSESTEITVGPATPSTFTPAVPGFLDSHALHECFVPASGVRTQCLRPFKSTVGMVLHSDRVPRRGLELNVSREEVAESRQITATVSAIGFDVQEERSKDANTFSAMDLDLRWDDEIVQLLEVGLADPVSNWHIQSNAEPGRLRVSMVNADGISVGPDHDMPLLLLEFRGLSADQSTLIEVESARFFDHRAENITGRTHDGRVTVFPCHPFDVKYDEEINSADALLALHLVTGSIDRDVTLECSADVNNDGHVGVDDVIAILRRAVGLELGAPQPNPRVAVSMQIDPMRHDELVLRWSGVAGYEATLNYDLSALKFVPGLRGESPGGPLVSVHELSPGQIRVAAAAATAHDGELRLRFTQISPDLAGQVDLGELHAFGPDGVELAPEVVDRSVTFAQIPLAPRRAGLVAAVPNPFNPQTEIHYRLVSPQAATLKIYDTSGRVVRSLRRASESAGEHRVTWDGLDDSGRRVSSGVYFVTLRTPTLRDQLRVALLK